jgi:transcriptional regulator with XRE-family HTH domain
MPLRGDLREVRKRLGWSQQKAAATLGVSQSYLSMLEMGERPLPDDLARKFVRAYQLSPTSLPPTQDPWTPRRLDPQELAEQRSLPNTRSSRTERKATIRPLAIAS